MRECPISGCTRRHSRDLAMCPIHWHAVPERLKREVWRTFRSARGSAEHLQALENAQAAVERREPEELFG